AVAAEARAALAEAAVTQLQSVIRTVSHALNSVELPSATRNAGGAAADAAPAPAAAAPAPAPVAAAAVAPVRADEDMSESEEEEVERPPKKSKHAKKSQPRAAAATAHGKGNSKGNGKGHGKGGNGKGTLGAKGGVEKGKGERMMRNFPCSHTEYQRRLANNECLRCGSKKHMVKVCRSVAGELWVPPEEAAQPIVG
ncbi:hypothetical protein Agub_g11296, partial [Astrephomene gubernaculifera]